jgi:hypothetical protein
MTSAKPGAVLVALGLLACGLSPASVRLDGFGPNLVDIIDDPVTDLLRYPQLNVLAPGWLVGVETNQSGYFHPYARTTGRWSVAAALDATLGDTFYVYSPSLALSAQTGKLSIGVAATIPGLGDWATPPKWLSEDTAFGWGAFFTGNWHVMLGARWRGSGFTLDGNLRGAISEEQYGPAPYCYSEVKAFAPSLRISWPGEHLSWRGMMIYDYTRDRQIQPDWTHPQVSLYRTLALVGGPTFTAGNLLVCAGLRAGISPSIHDWTCGFHLPVGVEWSPGPVVFRLGAEPIVAHAPWLPGKLGMVFENHVYIGLGLRPVEHLRLDFVPDMDNAANLRGWSLAAALDF